VTILLTLPTSITIPVPLPPSRSNALLEEEATLLVILLSSVIQRRDVEELDLKSLLGSSNNSEPVSKLRSLEVLLGEVLEVSLGEGNGGDDVDLALDRKSIEMQRRRRSIICKSNHPP